MESREALKLNVSTRCCNLLLSPGFLTPGTVSFLFGNAAFDVSIFGGTVSACNNSNPE